MSDAMIREGKEVLQALSDAGYEAYFVGGCVRDSLFGRPLKDIDIATSALPDEVMRLFARTAPTGLQHGTVTVIMRHHTFEVTTYRKESDYEQFRRPKQVEFISDLNEDLRRRDFTINAMAMSADGSVIDPFDGNGDLKAKRIRCVGDPLERFQEDALRMLRGIRFACEFGFEVEPDTWRGLTRHAPLLAHVAMERVSAELDKMIEGRAPDRAVRLLIESGLPPYFKQPVDWPLSHWRHCPEAFEREPLAQVGEARLRWPALFLLLEMTAKQAREAAKRLKFAGKKADFSVRLLEADSWMKQQLGAATAAESGGDDDEQAGFALLAAFAVAFSKDVARDWLTLAPWQADLHSDEKLRHWADQAGNWLDNVPVDSVGELEINGSELAAELDKRAGPWLGQMLQQLLGMVASRRVANERNALLQEAKKLEKQDLT
ncbi:MAG: tRNA nucleotidyltransferase [Paenibacillus sp.]|nr:tRNA nucleotidyltransferase [Paenibacillus sp.]